MKIDSTDFHIGEETHLFVDNWNIESVTGITRRWHWPERHPVPLIVKDRPWEIFPYFTYNNYTVLRDPQDGLFKCWYEDGGMLEAGEWPHTSRLLYAESNDGIHWVKPEFDIVLHEGRPTNIIAGYEFAEKPSPKNPLPGCSIHSQVVIIDPHPKCAEERFKMFFSLEKKNPPSRRIRCAHSPDGIHWTLYAESPRMGRADYVGDVSTLWYDETCREFVMNTRKAGMVQTPIPSGYACVDPSNPNYGWTRAYAPHRPDMMNKRRVFQCRSHDFIHWSEPVEILCPDDEFDNLDAMYYGMGQFQIGRMHFGTLGIFRQADDERDVRLVFSRDGLRWRNAYGGAPFLAPRGPEHWDAYMTAICDGPVDVGGTLHFFYAGTSGHHDYCMSGKENLDHPEAKDISLTRFELGLATLRRDGFCSLDTGDVRPGVIATRPMCGPNTSLRYESACTHSTLHINARCRNGGSIRAEVTDHNGRVLDGFSAAECELFTGDSLDHVFHWQGRSEIPGTEKFRRVVFRMERAEIFSFRHVAADQPAPSTEAPVQMF